MRQITSFLAVLLCFVSSAFCQQIPDGGSKMLGPYPMKTFKINNTPNAELKTSQEDGSTIYTLTTTAPSANPWDAQVSARSKYPCTKGDVMLIVFDGKMSASKDETGKAMVNVVFEKAGPNYDKSVEQNVALTKEWTTYYVPFIAANTFAPGEAQFNFQIGFKPQSLQLKNVQFYNYRKKLTLKDMPRSKYSYEGREPDAPWRKTAAELIEKHRMADISIKVTDKKGNPKEGLTVKISMQKHEFGWGTAVDANTFLIRDQYQKILKDNFNMVVFENDLKWPSWENPSNKAATLKALQYFNDQNIDVRGHVLVWPSWRWLPYHVKNHEGNPKQLQRVVLQHIQEEAGELIGKLKDWDVLNEPYTNTDLTRICGDEVMIEWFDKTKEIDSNPTRYINDFSIIGGGGTDKKHQDHYYKTIKYLVNNEAPVQGIGFQSHFGSHLTPITKVWSILDRFKEFNLEMKVTEFDIDIDDEDLQADYTRDFLTAIFAYPKMNGFLTWGFWENRHWRPQGAMYRADWTPKKNAIVWKDMIYKKWWTDETVTPDAKGNTKLRGFKGEYKYEIINKKGEVLKSDTFTLSDKGYKETIKIK